MTIDEIKKLCKKYNVFPSKSKGQNFLLCDEISDYAVQAGNLKKTDIVIEVGPGFGVLTKKIADRAGKVISIELDNNLINAAQELLRGAGNIKFINADILKLRDEQIAELAGNLHNYEKNYKIIANLPYNITGAFLKKFLSIVYRPCEMILMLQKEVALRICAKPGNLSILGVSVQYYAKPEIITNVGRDCFYPVPEVDSAIIKIAMKKDFLMKAPSDEEKIFFQILKIGFSAKRKMLKNNLFNGFSGMSKDIKILEIEKILAELGISAKARPQELAVDDWIKLAGKIEKSGK
ncbi:MAG: 16S rRNA (adenine(1518)-N(6)/adenine(1519)-N(6))-dimethyltransferase RsmA [bacterium]